jgi:hypothetical protein
MTENVQGIDLRITEGTKAPGDLRLEARIGGQWVPLKMDLALFMVDFFAENERHIQPFRPYWRQNGDRYFLSKCVEAVRDGWRKVAAETERQRRTDW